MIVEHCNVHIVLSIQIHSRYEGENEQKRREVNRDIPEKNGVAQSVGDSVFTFFAFEFEQYVMFQFILRRSLDGDKLK